MNEPLVGPEFGSYAPGEVKWLLKDLSHVDLEADVSVREKRIQSGEAHYAESLPIEYQRSGIPGSFRDGARRERSTVGARCRDRDGPGLGRAGE